MQEAIDKIMQEYLNAEVFLNENADGAIVTTGFDIFYVAWDGRTVSQPERWE